MDKEYFKKLAEKLKTEDKKSAERWISFLASRGNIYAHSQIVYFIRRINGIEQLALIRCSKWLDYDFIEHLN